uniref:G_PROTEIN_RECEP_F1_2 domain-containing protein n=1 Tax=Rhabditophanes sp. KR3021 TaxID=114890 RepID=A0AC35UB60_9BILA
MNSTTTYYNDFRRPLMGSLYLLVIFANCVSNILLAFIFYTKRAYFNVIPVYKISFQFLISQCLMMIAQIYPISTLCFINDRQLAQYIATHYISIAFLELDTIGYYSQTYMTVLLALNRANVFLFKNKLTIFGRVSVYFSISFVWCWSLMLVGLKKVFGIHKNFNNQYFYMFDRNYYPKSEWNQFWQGTFMGVVIYTAAILITSLYSLIFLKMTFDAKVKHKTVFTQQITLVGSPSNRTIVASSVLKTTIKSKKNRKKLKPEISVLIQSLILSLSACFEPILFNYIPQITSKFEENASFTASMIQNLFLMFLLTPPSWVFFFFNDVVESEFKKIRKTFFC